MRHQNMWEIESPSDIKAADIIPWQSHELGAPLIRRPVLNQENFPVARVIVFDRPANADLLLRLEGTSQLHTRQTWFPRFTIYIADEKPLPC